MDHFALPGDELAVARGAGTRHRNFRGYTTHAETDLLGLGVSAISHIGQTFSQSERDIAAWQGALGNQLWFGSVKLAGFTLHPLVLMFLVSGSLMISRIRIPKL
jgi:coproporphyrinogen III oxidase-like Fe-S oxidoreductase